MTSEYKQELIGMGVDVDKALDRFMGSEALYEKFLLKFVQDRSFQKMVGFVNAGDIPQAFMQAHTMKALLPILNSDIYWKSWSRSRNSSGMGNWKGYRKNKRIWKSVITNYVL